MQVEKLFSRSYVHPPDTNSITQEALKEDPVVV
jgi:hypothetical protein